MGLPAESGAFAQPTNAGIVVVLGGFWCVAPLALVFVFIAFPKATTLANGIDDWAHAQEGAMSACLTELANEHDS